MKTLLISPLLAFAAVPLFAGHPEISGNGPAIYVAPDQGFEVDIVAGLAKKHVPVRVVMAPQYADYILKANQVQLHKKSAGSKVVHCLFMDCIGMQDTTNVSVQLIDTHNHQIVWGYNVFKADYGKKRQSMAEAIAKHLKHYLQRQAKKQMQIAVK